ncbi:hypothetical protein [Caldisericum sp.]|uniref:hypothetical protein n=1 Tax=Caldisericum sp. TaxID=2499687 RepID=UPI003D1416E6
MSEDKMKEKKDDCTQCGGTIDGYVYTDFIIAYAKLYDIIKQKGANITADDIRQCMTWQVGSRPCEIFTHEYLLKSFVVLRSKYPKKSSSELLFLALARIAHKYTRAFDHLAQKLKIPDEIVKQIKSIPKEECVLEG